MILTFWKTQSCLLDIVMDFDCLRKNEFFWYYTIKAGQLISD